MSTVTSSDGTTIAYEKTGSGPPVVLVDAAFAHRAINPSARQLAELLAPDFTVYLYDRRGRGDSGNTAPYAVEREVEDLGAVIAAAGGSAYAVGGSSGAVLALEGAARGLPITKLAMYEPPFIVDDSRPPRPDDYVETLDRLVAEGRRGDAVEYFMTAAVGLPPEFIGPMRQNPMWADFEKVAHTISYDGRIMGDTMSGRPLPRDRWASVDVPVLVLDGDASYPFVGAAADALAEVLSDARRRTLAGQSHDVAPDAIAPVLKEFFAA